MSSATDDEQPPLWFLQLRYFKFRRGSERHL